MPKEPGCNRISLMLERMVGGISPVASEIINKAASEAFSSVSEKFGKEVGASSEQCFSVVWAMKQKLKSDFPSACQVYTRFFYPNGFYKEHVFLRCGDLVIDPTYQQFLGEEQRRRVPCIAIMRASSLEQLSRDLVFYRIPKECHYAWLKPVFPEHYKAQKEAEFWYNRQSKHTSFLG